jgi:hypothetical protein
VVAEGVSIILSRLIRNLGLKAPFVCYGFENRPVFFPGPNRVDPAGSLKSGEFALPWPGFYPEDTTQGFVPGNGRRRKFKSSMFCFQVKAKRTVEMAPTEFQTGSIYSTRKEPRNRPIRSIRTSPKLDRRSTRTGIESWPTDRHPTIHILNIRAPPLIHPIDIERTRAKRYPDLILRDQPPSGGPWKLHKRGTRFPNPERPMVS